MEVSLQNLNCQVDAFIQETRSQLNECPDSAQEQLQQVTRSLGVLVQRFGTREYSFNLVMERYVEKLYKQIHPFLPDILSAYRPEDYDYDADLTRADIAFTAYYALSLIYKKENKYPQLKEMIDEHNAWATAYYPLAYEICSRYHKRMHQYDHALRCDNEAIQWLDSEGIRNCALGISFASTVCRMYEQNSAVRQEDWQSANQYISDAIAYNPSYPKYHFLRGKLLFYAHRSLHDDDRFRAYCEEAIQCVNTASNLQRRQIGKHHHETLEEYRILQEDIRREMDRRSAQALPFQPMSGDMLEQRIREVLNASEEYYCRPQNPNLKPGQPFVFISYAHADFRSVYCDLLRLYAQGICFQFDGNLCEGKSWEEEVRHYLSREECLGVLFYISKHTPLSAAVEKECQFLQAQQGSKFSFSVNLEGSTPPSEILIQSILEHQLQGYREKHVDSSRIINFLSFFNDSITYIAKSPLDGPEGSKHISHLIHALIRQDPALQLNTQAPAYAQL